MQLARLGFTWVGIGLVLLATSSSPPRLPAASLSQSMEKYTPLDLWPKANQDLKTDFHTRAYKGNNLGILPQGAQKLGGVKFFIGKGLIQLGSKQITDKPARVVGIEVDRAFTRLHILHATAYQAADDTVIASYTIHYADKTKAVIDIVYGKDVRNWWNRQDPNDTTRGKQVWQGQNDYIKTLPQPNNVVNRLYLTTWENPHPRKKVVSIDYAAADVQKNLTAPFCVAMTVESR
jgi:hypothetical protein